MIPQTFTVRLFLLFSFSFFTILVVVSMRYIKPTHVGFRAHVKIASRIVSYRIVTAGLAESNDSLPPGL